jgi:chitinase
MCSAQIELSTDFCAQAVYNGHLWTAKWWSEGDVPGSAAGDWTDDGPC